MKVEERNQVINHSKIYLLQPVIYPVYASETIFRCKSLINDLDKKKRKL